jgi:hypothetical protein
MRIFFSVKRKDGKFPDTWGVYLAQTEVQALLEHYRSMGFPVVIDNGVVYMDLGEDHLPVSSIHSWDIERQYLH